MAGILAILVVRLADMVLEVGFLGAVGIELDDFGFGMVEPDNSMGMSHDISLLERLLLCAYRRKVQAPLALIGNVTDSSAVMFLRLLLSLLLFCTPVLAADTPRPQPAISMVGTPRYGPGFTQLDYVNPAAPQGGTLHLAVSGSFDSLNPYSVRGNRATGLTLTGESLMGRSWDEPFSLYGLIAESITTPDDRSWVEFQLRAVAKWSDGSPITVEDVLFSFEQLRDHGRPNHRTYYKKVSQAEATGPRSVRFTFDMSEGGDREMPLIMGLMPILQKAWWSGRDIGAPGLDIPVSSGPYRLTAVNPGRQLTYEKNPDYWGKNLPFNRGQWNFDRIIYDYYRDDDVALEAFKAGAYDLRREMDPIKWLNGYTIPALAEGRIIKAEIPNGRTEPVRGFIFNTRRELFADPQVREALTYALDFAWMNRVLFGNVYKRSQSTFPNSELAATGVPRGLELQQLAPFRSRLPAALFTTPLALPDGSEGMRRNLRTALTLLKQAGWTLQNGELVKNGKKFEFEILLVSADDEKVALEFSRSLQRLGITAHVRTVDSAQYQARLNEYGFDMTINFWSSTLSPGNEQVYYWGSAAADQPGSRNYAGVKDPVVDALAESIAKAQTRPELVARARALDRVLMWGHYIIPLTYLGRDLVAYQAGLGRPETTPVYGILPEQTWWRVQ